MNTPHVIQPQLLKETEAAPYIRVKPQTLRVWRIQDKGPRYIKAGDKLVRYRITDLDAWLDSQAIDPEGIHK